MTRCWLYLLVGRHILVQQRHSGTKCVTPFCLLPYFNIADHCCLIIQDINAMIDYLLRLHDEIKCRMINAFSQCISICLTGWKTKLSRWIYYQF